VGLLTPDCHTPLLIVALVALVALVASAGAPLPTGFDLGTLSAQPHGPNLVVVALLGAAAGVSGNLLDYGLGRVGRPKLYAWLLRAFLKFSEIGAKNPTMGLGGGSGMAILLMRYTLTALASPLSILAGVVRAPLMGFLAWDAPGGAVAVVGNLALGRRFGPGLLSHGGHMAAWWGVLAFARMAPILLLIVLWDWRRTAHRHSRQLASAQVDPASTWLLLAPSGPIWPHPYRESVSAAAESSVEVSRGKPCARLRRP
jgi:membrane protein DedA with SNARE-associated domain